MTRSSPKLSLVATPRSGSPPEPSDDDLMARARAGVPGAYDALVIRHQARMLRVAYRLLADRAAAADAVQNTFVELFCSLERYEARGKFKSYVYRLLLNHCRRTWRRDRTTTKVSQTISDHSNNQSLQPLDGLQVDVEKLLARLPEHQRSAVLLHYAGGLTQQQIADALELPVGTVKSRIFEAMARMRQLMEAP